MRRATVEGGPAEFLREMVVAAARNYEEALTLLARVDDARSGAKGTERAAWVAARGEAQNEVHSCEAGLAYRLAVAFDRLGSDGPGLDEGEFRPFGVVVGGVAYVAQFDPGDMRRGIIGRVELEMLLDLG